MSIPINAAAVKVVALSGGIGQPSTTRLLTDRIAEAVREQLGEAGSLVELSIIELREFATDTAHATVNGVESARLGTAKDLVRGADALIVVSPVFNAGIAGLVKSFLDLFVADDLAGMPVLLAATGGTARHSLVIDHGLRPIAAYLKMWAMPTGVFVATAEWGETGGPTARIRRAAQELVNFVARTPRTVPSDGFEEVTPFSHLLHNGEARGKLSRG